MRTLNISGMKASKDSRSADGFTSVIRRIGGERVFMVLWIPKQRTYVDVYTGTLAAVTVGPRQSRAFERVGVATNVTSPGQAQRNRHLKHGGYREFDITPRLARNAATRSQLSTVHKGKQMRHVCHDPVVLRP